MVAVGLDRTPWRHGARPCGGWPDAPQEASCTRRRRRRQTPPRQWGPRLVWGSSVGGETRRAWGRARCGRSVARRLGGDQPGARPSTPRLRCSRLRTPLRGGLTQEHLNHPRRDAEAVATARSMHRVSRASRARRKETGSAPLRRCPARWGPYCMGIHLIWEDPL